MVSEMDILLEIYSDVVNNIQIIKSSQSRILNIKKNINSLNNNYFDIKCNDIFFNEYLNKYNNTNICEEMIINFERLKYYLDDLIKNCCDHEWIHDSIDITPDLSQNICYCSKCEITKK